VTVFVDVLIDSEDCRGIPTYETDGSSGFDLRSTINYVLEPGMSVLIPTGLRFKIQNGYELQVRSRSGLALKHGVVVLNQPGTIDSDYRGLVGVILINLSKKPFAINKDDRIAQGVITPVERAVLRVVSQKDYENDMTNRGSRGFGSTGKT